MTERAGWESQEDCVLQRDLEEIAQELLLQDWQGRSVFVTGATGLIGAQIVRALLCANRLRGADIQVYMLVRSAQKAERIFGGLLDLPQLHVICGDVLSEIRCEAPIDYIIHGASPTGSKFFVEQPVETIMTAINGTGNVLAFAREKKVRGLVFLSSLEVYGVPDPKAGPITERDYGYLDPVQIRSSYSEGKRMAECLTCAYAAEYGVPARILRLSQTFGPGVARDDGRVFAEFARCAIEGRDIVLHTAGNTVRTYCYTKDAVSAILTVLVKGVDGEAYNVSNPETRVSIREMAELVCRLYPAQGIRVRVEIPEDIASFGYNPEMVIALDSSKLSTLGWRPTVDLPGMFVNMIDSIKERSQTGGKV